MTVNRWRYTPAAGQRMTMAGLQTTREEEGGGEGEELGVGYKLWPTVAAAGCIPGH